MLFPIAIHKDPQSAYGVTVPDVPGCFSFGDTLDQALINAKEAIIGHIETQLELGEPVDIKVSEIEKLQAEPEFEGAAWAFVNVDLTELDAKPERVNISLPKFVLNRIDHHVASKHETRSGFLARAALAALAHEK
jgi:predicted RNase H-like HicB family nuclease